MKHPVPALSAMIIVFAMPVGAADAQQSVVDVHQVMVAQVNPQGLALWDITNAATGDDGRIDPKKLTPDHWKALLKIGQSLKDGGEKLATTGKLRAAAPGVKIQDEGQPKAAKAADVQRWIDAKPAKFRELSKALQMTGAGLVDAVTRRDMKKLGELSGSLDEVCESCHALFWYPNQGVPK